MRKTQLHDGDGRDGVMSEGISFLLVCFTNFSDVAPQKEVHCGRVGEGLLHLLLTCRPIAQPHPRPQHDLARHLRRLRHPLSTCCLASRWKEDMAFLRSFYVADDIWRFA